MNMEELPIEEKPVEKTSPLWTAIITAGVVLAATGTYDKVTEEAQLADIKAEIALEQKAEAKVIPAQDKLLAEAEIAMVDVEVTDSTGKVSTVKQAKEIKGRIVDNCDTKYPYPVPTTGVETFVATFALQRPGKPDSTLCVITDKPIADRLWVGYTTTAEK